MKRLSLYEGSLEPLIEWAHSDYPKGAGNAYRRLDEPPFMGFVRQQLPGADSYRFWASIVSRKDSAKDGWVAGFPHVHAWPERVVTMVCYLSQCDGGELVIGTEPTMTDPQIIEPLPHRCAFIDGHEWHGVRPVTGPIDRLAIIVAAFSPVVACS